MPDTVMFIRTRSYTGIQPVLCCLCGCRYQEQQVAGVLRWEGKELGEVCPRCLKLPPSAAVSAVSKGASSAGVAAGAGSRRLAAFLADLDQWPVTVDELMRAERAALRDEYRFLTEDDLCVLVDDRYKLMLIE